jgi:hypothetical protein
MYRWIPVVLLLFTSNVLQAQSEAFGFGCLGFVSGYGGYSYQVYKPDGLNGYIAVLNNNREDSLVSPMNNFGKASGYRVGINLFRAKVTNFVLTAKGFYQSITEKHESLERIFTGIRSTTFKLNLRNWGIGVDLGISITNALSWKVVDGALNFNNVTFTNTENSSGARTVVKKYKTTSTSLGYSLGTGFILEVVDEYFSIEGVAGYTEMSIDQLQLDDGTILTVNENSSVALDNFINSGGFNAVIQFNVGFPL